MTDINHDDPQVQRLFDLELAAQRAGLPTIADTSYDYLYGIARAQRRSPNAVLALAAQCTAQGKLPDYVDIDPDDGDATLKTQDYAEALAALEQDMKAGAADVAPPQPGDPPHVIEYRAMLDAILHEPVSVSVPVL
ncbi:MAG: hypothetical protein ABI640_21945 [Gammaproteobacteria bacterium]